MNKNPFGRDEPDARLVDLYRAAEERGDADPVAPELISVFTADQELIQQLGRLALDSRPLEPARGRASFLASVTRHRNTAPAKERTAMIGRRLGARGLAVLAAAGIFVGGAVTVGASGGVGDAAGNANQVLATLHVPHKTHGHGNSQSGEQGPDNSNTPVAEGTRRAVEGIPTSNPQHHPADGDGTCDKGETAVKTAPSGVSVNVPCQAAEDHGKADKTPHANKTPRADKTPKPDDANETPEADKTQERDETPEASETPEAGETPGSGAHGEQERGPGAPPKQPNPHAAQGSSDREGR